MVTLIYILILCKQFHFKKIIKDKDTFIKQEKANQKRIYHVKERKTIVLKHVVRCNNSIKIMDYTTFKV